jgi:large subunit ribosomal protein L19
MRVNMKYEITNQALMNYVEYEYLTLKIQNVSIADKIKLGIYINEGGKIRTQLYEGVVIAKKNSGINEMITIRRTFQGIGIERCFLINSPKVQFLKILQSARVRRSKLYYLREVSGKITRLKERFD